MNILKTSFLINVFPRKFFEGSSSESEDEKAIQVKPHLSKRKKPESDSEEPTPQADLKRKRVRPRSLIIENRRMNWRIKVSLYCS